MRVDPDRIIMAFGHSNVSPIDLLLLEGELCELIDLEQVQVTRGSLFRLSKSMSEL